MATHAAIADSLLSLLSGEHEPGRVWLENFIEYYRRNDIEGMPLLLRRLAHSGDPGREQRFLQLYEAACHHAEEHSDFFVLLDRHFEAALSSIIPVLDCLLSRRIAVDHGLLQRALRQGCSMLNVELEKRAVRLAVRCAGSVAYAPVVSDHIRASLCAWPAVPSAVDRRRLCTAVIIAKATGIELETVRARFPDHPDLALDWASCYAAEPKETFCPRVGLRELIEFYPTTNECTHECYHD